MPCNSEYLEPTGRERELRRTAKLYVYVLVKIGQPTLPKLLESVNNIYTSEDYVSELCATLRRLKLDDPTRFNNLVYNAHDKDSRNLADWWEDHQEADRKREAKEQAKIDGDKVLESALAKLTAAGLTNDERRVLRLRWTKDA